MQYPLHSLRGAGAARTGAAGGGLRGGGGGDVAELGAAPVSRRHLRERHDVQRPAGAARPGASARPLCARSGRPHHVLRRARARQGHAHGVSGRTGRVSLLAVQQHAAIQPSIVRRIRSTELRVYNAANTM